MSDQHHRCMNLGPYPQDHAIIFHDIREGVYSFHVIELHQLTLGFIQDPDMSIFKLPRHRRCLVAIYAADSGGNLCFEVKLLPSTDTTETTEPTQGTSSSSSSNYCYHQGCEPYQLTCEPGEVPACEVREVDEGGVTTTKTVMHCITPSSSSSSASSASSDSKGCC